MKLVIYMISLFTILYFPIQANATGYNHKCLPSSKWKKGNQYKFSAKGKSYQLVESSKALADNAKVTQFSLCIVKENLAVPIKLVEKTGKEVDFNSYLSGGSAGGSLSIKKISNTIFALVYTYDSGDVGNILKYNVDVTNPMKPKAKLTKYMSG
jgi:hypothetical protein